MIIASEPRERANKRAQVSALHLIRSFSHRCLFVPLSPLAVRVRCCRVYSSYAKSYDDVRLFELLSERRSGLKNFLLLTDACEGTTLATLMITPVQRVGRYVLLLETILKNAPRGPAGAAIDGLADIELALAEMKRVANLINETVALWEATSKVVELQAKMDVSFSANTTKQWKQTARGGLNRPAAAD